MEIQKKNQISVKADIANKPEAAAGHNSEPCAMDHSSLEGWRRLMAALSLDKTAWCHVEGAEVSTATAA